MLIIEYSGLVFVFVGYAFASEAWMGVALYIVDHIFFAMAIAIKTYEKSKMKDASHLRRVQQEIKVMEGRGGTASRCMEKIAVAR